MIESGLEPAEPYITLAHGNGGYFMRQLIRQVFARYLANPWLDTQADAAIIPFTQSLQELFITTDGFSVQPLEFPGGNIGSLAVYGTVNDLAVAGAIPQYLTLNAFIEEGLEMALLVRIVQSIAQAAAMAQIQIVAGDTKVVPRGQGGGLYLATTGVGVRACPTLSMRAIQPGDRLLVSGPIGDHGISVLLARQQFGLSGQLQSDCGSVLALAQALYPYSQLRFMRDPTRGGLATVAHEISQATGYAVRLEQAQIPVRDTVQTVCDLLGYDPYYLACEGRVVAVVGAAEAEQALAQWRQLPTGAGAALIGTIESAHYHKVLLTTPMGGERPLDELEDDPLPRIC